MYVGVRWIRMDGQSLPSNSYENNGELFIQNVYFHEKKQIFFLYYVGELFIQNVKPSDGGRYGCQALDPNGRVIYTAITNLVISCKF